MSWKSSNKSIKLGRTALWGQNIMVYLTLNNSNFNFDFMKTSSNYIVPIKKRLVEALFRINKHSLNLGFGISIKTLPLLMVKYNCNGKLDKYFETILEMWPIFHLLSYIFKKYIFISKNEFDNFCFSNINNNKLGNFLKLLD